MTAVAVDSRAVADLLLLDAKGNRRRIDVQQVDFAKQIQQFPQVDVIAVPRPEQSQTIFGAAVRRPQQIHHAIPVRPKTLPAIPDQLIAAGLLLGKPIRVHQCQKKWAKRVVRGSTLRFRSSVPGKGDDVR